MVTFKIISETGFFAGTVKGIDREECENLCRDSGVDIDNQYMLIHENKEILPSSPYIEDIINY